MFTNRRCRVRATLLWPGLVASLLASAPAWVAAEPAPGLPGATPLPAPAHPSPLPPRGTDAAEPGRGVHVPKSVQPAPADCRIEADRSGARQPPPMHCPRMRSKLVV